MVSYEKLATVIENETGHGLTMKVGNPHRFVRLASVKRGENYTVRLCVDWTYQEFVLEDQSDAANKLYVNSDDCCDYERIVVKEADGVLYVETVARQHLHLLGGRDLDAPVQDRSPFMAENFMEKMSAWKFWVKAW